MMLHDEIPHCFWTIRMPGTNCLQVLFLGLINTDYLGTYLQT